MPAILLARKLADGGVAQRGAFACTGFSRCPNSSANSRAGASPRDTEQSA